MLWLSLVIAAGCGNAAKDSSYESAEETGDGTNLTESVVESGDGTVQTEPVAEAGEETVSVPDAAGEPEGGSAVTADTVTAEDKANEETENRDNVSLSPWAGKTLSISGDSISTFTGYIPDYYSKFYPEMGEIADVNDTWWMQLIQKTGMKLLKNASYSGATVSGQSNDNHDGKYGCGNQRMADLRGDDGSAPDVIIIMLGANDLLNGIPLGNYDGVSQVPEGNIETFSEAYALMLDKMKTWYPDAEIFCCTAVEVSRWNEAGEKFAFENEHKLTMKDYNAWIKVIAQEKGVKLIDTYPCGITYENAQQYTTDGTHPNAAGAKLIAEQIYKTFQ